MKVSELEHLCGAVCLTGEYQDREIACGYTCDLLSHVMGRGQADMAWITVQTHMNVIAVAALLIGIIRYKKTSHPAPKNRTRALVYGALCVALSFMLSYIKLFSLPMGGSLTLCSMLPIAAYACAFGPLYGFVAGLAFGMLQLIQDFYVIHWAQLLLDYFFAFACYGIAAYFPGRLTLGVAVAGLCRMLCSTLSGGIFFADSAVDAGWSNAWLYSLAYNGSTIGAETVLCVLVSLLPPVKKVLGLMKSE